MNCSLRGSSVHGILQARILEWVAMPFRGTFPTQGLNPGLLHWQADSLLCEPPGKPVRTILPFSYQSLLRYLLFVRHCAEQLPSSPPSQTQHLAPYASVTPARLTLYCYYLKRKKKKKGLLCLCLSFPSFCEQQQNLKRDLQSLMEFLLPQLIPVVFTPVIQGSRFD